MVVFFVGDSAGEIYSRHYLSIKWGSFNIHIKLPLKTTSSSLKPNCKNVDNGEGINAND